MPSTPTRRLLDRAVPALTALTANPYFAAIRAGMIAVVPLTIVGGLFMIVAHVPVAGWDAVVSPYRTLLGVPVAATFVNVPRTTPPIIGHHLVSGGDPRAALWGAASILIGMAVYYPFARSAERQRLRAGVRQARSS